MVKRLTYAEVKRYIEIESGSGCKLLSREYLNAKRIMNFLCRCGNEFETNYDNFKNGKHQCNECGFKIRTNKRTKSDEQFKSEVYNLVRDEYTFLQEYVNTETKIKCIHNKCGHIYSVKPANFLKGTRCPQCMRPNYDRNTKQFKQDVYELVGDEYNILGTYSNAHTKVKLKHNECSYEWDVSPNSFLRGSRCPQCFGNVPKTQEQFEQEVYELVGDEYIVLGKYTNAKTKIKMRHTLCGCKYHVEPTSFLQGTQCPQCTASRGEQAIREFLQSENIKFQPEYSFDDLLGVGGGLLRFDFAVFDSDILELLIEYDGIFHYEQQYDEDGFKTLQIHDERKNQYCKDNDIPLLRIPYWEFDNIEIILEEWFYENKKYYIKRRESVI